MIELDGLPADTERISALALTNYGHFTSMVIENRRVRGLSLHLDRLVGDSRRLFDTELDPDHIRHLVRHALGDAENPMMVRVTVYDPDLDFGRPGAHARPHVLVSVRPATPTPPEVLRLQTIPYCRDMPEVKHVGLCPTLMHRRAAQHRGFDDVLFTGADGSVSEVATSNIGVVDGNRVIWPAGACLPGVTMRLLDQEHGEHPTAVLTVADLAAADAVFTTNAAVGIRAVSGVDATMLTGEHPALVDLRKQYTDISPEPV